MFLHSSRSALSGVSSYKGTNLIIRAPPSSPHLTLITSLTSHLQIPTHRGLRLPQMNWGRGNINIQSITPSLASHILASQMEVAVPTQDVTQGIKEDQIM